MKRKENSNVITAMTLITADCSKEFIGKKCKEKHERNVQNNIYN